MYSYCDFGAMSQAEEKLRHKAMESYKLAERLMSELEATAAARKAGVGRRKAPTDKGEAGPVIPDRSAQEQDTPLPARKRRGKGRRAAPDPGVDDKPCIP